MTFLLKRKIIFTQLRQLHKNVIFQKTDFDLAKEKKAFYEVLPQVIDSAVSSPKLVVPEIRDFVKEFMNYSLTNQTQDVGFKLVLGYQILEKPEYITEQSLHTARVLGWCIETFQAYMFIVDDIMDDSPTRFGRPCWHRLPGVGLKAVNDSYVMHTLFPQMLRTHFGKTPLYNKLTEIFEQVLLPIFIGQHLDCRPKTISYDTYNTICKYKTTPYYYYFPLRLLFSLLENSNLEINEEITEICLDIAHFLQMQYDFLDVYGDENVIGKVGTDIQEGKCSWLAAVARQRCDDTQRAIFDQHYGSKEPDSVDRVKRLYDELQMPVVYERDRETLRQTLVRRINALPSDRLQSYFYFKGGL